MHVCARVLQSARFGYRQTEMKHNKFKTNKLRTAASQDQSQKPQQDYVFSNLPVSGIQGQTEMKHTKFKTNKFTTAAWTKAENHKTSKKGFLRGGSDGVDHVAREVLQHGVARRGSPKVAPSSRSAEAFSDLLKLFRRGREGVSFFRTHMQAMASIP